MRALVDVALAGLLIAGCSSTSSRSNDDSPSSWGSVRIGSVFESKTVTRLEKPFPHETRSTTKQTLLARNDTEASVRIELIEGAKTSARDVNLPLRHDKPAPHDGSTVTTADEKCTVAAGTFDCTRTTVEFRQGDVVRSTETWMTKRLPVPLKSTVTNENMTITTELTSITGTR